jgi:hypothetical protein
MPGAYAHLTLANVLSKTRFLETELELPLDACKAILRYSKFCDMGAISPDYPYLKLGPGSKKAYRWSDLMHNRFDKPTLENHKANIIHNGIRILRQMKGQAKLKCFAWFAGYSSHVGADVTVHPIVNLKVGNYDDGNQKKHRICEMHQDAYIYSLIMNLQIGVSEHINGIIGSCTNSNNAIDDDISHFWTTLLEQTFPRENDENPPSINDWHKAVQLFLGNIAEEGYRLFPFARHVGIRSGLTYPNPGDVDKPEYIDLLSTPIGNNTSYDDIFNHATTNIGQMWKMIADAVFGNGRTYLTRLGIWNLDSGKDENDNIVFWS